MSGEKQTTEREERNAIVGGTLYLVATPIGNLADLSERARKTLSEVDFIAAEDTRNSGKLLACFGISKPLVSYFEHNKQAKGEVIVSRLLAGESCALVTDAGTPAISDPGEDLVRLCAERGVPVTSVPGACAAVNALALSGLSTGKFVFEGFLPTHDKKERAERLAELKKEKRTAILYEAPHKLRNTLEDLLEALGDRRIALCRELTKMNEEVLRCTLSEAVAVYEGRTPRGEYVLILEGSTGNVEKEFWADMSVEEHFTHHLNAGLTKMDAIKAVAKDRGVPKNEIYKQING